MLLKRKGRGKGKCIIRSHICPAEQDFTLSEWYTLTGLNKILDQIIFLSVLNVIQTDLLLSTGQVIGQVLVCIGLFSVSGNHGFNVLTKRQEEEL